MKYHQFKEKVKKYPIFHSHMFHHLSHDVATLRRQVTEWIAKGHILPLKKGIYTLKDGERAVGLSRYFLANQLYAPSYISLESALSYYGFIPEAVYAMTSVSSKKTQQFSNALGNFIYYHIKADVYDYFHERKDEFGNTFLIATPEKALVDFLYLKGRSIKKFDAAIFKQSFRFQNLQAINKRKLKLIAEHYNNLKLMQLIKLLPRD